MPFSFLAPFALAGLLTVPIILLLHLLRNRREEVSISSLRFWIGLEQQARGNKPRNIPLTLMLFLQLLTACALTFAAAQPVFSFLLTQPRQRLFVLDTTTSMLARENQATRFDAARAQIHEELSQLRAEDTFAVIALSRQPEVLVQGTHETRAVALEALDSLAAGGTGLDLPAALTLADGLIVPGAPQQPEIIVLTDGTYPNPDALPPLQAPLRWNLIAAAPAPNQALVNVSSQTWPDGRQRVFARIINYSDEAVVRTLRITADGSRFDTATVHIGPQSETTYVWTLPDDVDRAAVEIVESDALMLDNRAELALMDAFDETSSQVLLLSNTPDILARALEAQPGLDLTTDLIDTQRTDLDSFDMLVYDGLPPTLTEWPQNNIWVVSPPLDHPLLTGGIVTNIARARPNVDTGSLLLAGINLSGVYFSRVPTLIMPPDWATVDLYSLPNEVNPEVPLMYRGIVGNRHIVVWNFDLANSNLAGRLALPLLTANVLSTVLFPAPPAVTLLGEPVWVRSDFSVETPEGYRMLPPLPLPDTEQRPFRQTQRPGIYRVLDPVHQPLASFAVHAGSAQESNLMPRLQPDVLTPAFFVPAAVAPPETAYTEFWPWLAGLALVVVICEGWLAWRR